MADYAQYRRQVPQDRRGNEAGDLGAVADAGAGEGHHEVLAEA